MLKKTLIPQHPGQMPHILTTIFFTFVGGVKVFGEEFPSEPEVTCTPFAIVYICVCGVAVGSGGVCQISLLIYE